MSLVNLIRKSSWSFYAAFFLFTIATFLLALRLYSNTGGTYPLPTDEAFFQLSTAKMLAFNHVWSITPYYFHASTPSLLYPLLLAASFLVLGTKTMVMLVVNLVLATILIWQVQQWLSRKGLSSVYQFIVLVAVMTVASLPVMVAYGCERPLLLLTAFLFASRLCDEWDQASFSRTTLAYGALLMAARYDGILMVAAAGMPLLFQRRMQAALEIILWSIVPISVFGIISLYKGGYFLPSSIVMSPATSWISLDWLSGSLTAIIVPIIRRVSLGSRQQRLRYPAILVASVAGIFMLAHNISALAATDSAARRVYRQEYLAGRFIRRSFYRTPIASDDIGVISYLGDGTYLDLSGAGNAQVATARRQHVYDTALIRSLLERNGIYLSIVSGRYAEPFPPGWVRTAKWIFAAEGAEHVRSYTFFGRDSVLARELIAHMENYAPLMPKDVKIEYFLSRQDHYPKTSDN